MIKVFTPKRTSRIEYVFDWFLRELVGVDFELTTSETEFSAYQGAKLSYTKQPVQYELHFKQGELLLESGIKPQQTSFLANADNGLPTDVFAAAFYLVSRYEEYLPFEADDHGRFPARASVAKQNGFLQQPVIDKWAKQVRQTIAARFPEQNPEEPQYAFEPSYDVDIAWAYKHRSAWRTAGGYVRALLTGDFADIGKRTRVLFGQPDPYFTFDYIESLTERFNLQPKWFFQLGEHGRYDKSIPAQHPAMQKLLKQVAAHAEIGMHPSYASNSKPERIAHEKRKLENAIGTEVTKSRQHFLVMRLPETYRRLIELGITDEYSMGYSSDPGFRASTCSPFYFYDLEAEKKTSLRVHSFSIMDASFQYFGRRHRTEEVPAVVAPIIEAVKSAGGTLMTLFHNNAFSEVREWVGWRGVYEEILEMARA